MNLYDELYPAVLALLTELGGPATLIRTVQTGGSKYSQAGKASSTQSISTLAVVGPEDVVDDQGRLVSATVATILAQPMENDRLTLGQASYLVGKVTAIAPQGQPIFYKAVVTA